MRRVLGMFLALVLTPPLVSPQVTGRASAGIDLGVGKITISYGQPALAGRSIADMIVPGFAWRMGMNDPTTLDTTANLDFYGKLLPAGKYVLFARPDEYKNWVLLVSSRMTGSVLDPSTVVLEAPLFFVEENEVQDSLKITLARSGSNNVWLTVAWGTYRLRGTFKAQ
jgi:DUF2911 family protein